MSSRTALLTKFPSSRVSIRRGVSSLVIWTTPGHALTISTSFLMRLPVAHLRSTWRLSVSMTTRSKESSRMRLGILKNRLCPTMSRTLIRRPMQKLLTRIRPCIQSIWAPTMYGIKWSTSPSTFRLGRPFARPTSWWKIATSCTAWRHWTHITTSSRTFLKCKPMSYLRCFQRTNKRSIMTRIGAWAPSQVSQSGLQPPVKILKVHQKLMLIRPL